VFFTAHVAAACADLVLLAARTEDDVSHLEVWVYEEAGGEDGEANLFVHHDLLLPGAAAAGTPWLQRTPPSPR
jgi:periodic tryptophan protein 1